MVAVLESQKSYTRNNLHGLSTESFGDEDNRFKKMSQSVIIHVDMLFFPSLSRHYYGTIDNT